MGMSKQEIIGNIYFYKAGFGSKNTTLKDAREKTTSTTMKNVEYSSKKCRDKNKPERL